MSALEALTAALDKAVLQSKQSQDPGDPFAYANIINMGRPKPGSPSCNKCHNSASKLPTKVSLKQCGKCRQTLYCSRECQKADWKAHKKSCGRFNANTPNPTQAMINGTWLHGLPEDETSARLIDSYRLRATDELNFGGIERGPYEPACDQESILVDFRKYLDGAEKTSGLLPPWWGKEKREECEQTAVDSCGSACIYKKVEKDDVNEQYGTGFMAMQLRMVAETAEGMNVMELGGAGVDGIDLDSTRKTA